MTRGPRPTVPVVLTAAERALLEMWARERRGPRSRTERATVLLRAAAGDPTVAIGRAVGLAEDTVRLWRRRWQASAGWRAATSPEDRATVLDEILADAPRPGTPATFTPEQITQLIALACEDPAASGRPVSHWTPQELAAELITRKIGATISARHVGRFLDFRRGRPQAAPEPVLAERAAAGPRRVRRADPDDLRTL
jgi:putative transposase